MRTLLIAFLFISPLLLSCDDESVLTQAELTAVELQKVMTENDLHRIIITIYGAATPGSVDQSRGSVYSFSNGFVHVSGHYYSAYNLEMLAAYDIRMVVVVDDLANSVKSEKSLVLTFEYI